MRSPATTAPPLLPVWSSNVPRHRLSRTGNRQLNAAIHRIALTQARHHQPAKELIKRRVENGKSDREALHILKRHLSRTVYQALQTDQQASLTLRSFTKELGTAPSEEVSPGGLRRSWWRMAADCSPAPRVPMCCLSKLQYDPCRPQAEGE
nr:IS110 family transposase [[Pseudopropionibacterium] massiliense]